MLEENIIDWIRYEADSANIITYAARDIKADWPATYHDFKLLFYWNIRHSTSGIAAKITSNILTVFCDTWREYIPAISDDIAH